MVYMMGGKNQVLDHLSTLFKALESFYHPSNYGSHSVSICRILPNYLLHDNKFCHVILPKITVQYLQLSLLIEEIGNEKCIIYYLLNGCEDCTVLNPQVQVLEYRPSLRYVKTEGFNIKHLLTGCAVNAKKY